MSTRKERGRTRNNNLDKLIASCIHLGERLVLSLGHVPLWMRLINTADCIMRLVNTVSRWMYSRMLYFCSHLRKRCTMRQKDKKSNKSYRIDSMPSVISLSNGFTRLFHAATRWPCRLTRYLWKFHCGKTSLPPASMSHWNTSVGVSLSCLLVRGKAVLNLLLYREHTCASSPGSCLPKLLQGTPWREGKMNSLLNPVQRIDSFDTYHDGEATVLVLVVQFLQRM